MEIKTPTSLAVVGGPDGVYPLRAGDRIEVRPENARAYVVAGEGPARRLANAPRAGVGPIRVVRGPQSQLLDLAGFLSTDYQVGMASNRVGVRLEGNAFPHTLSLPSEPAIPGVVQLPPNGQPIVLGPDGPTIGGYPKVAVVIDADLDRIGRLRPGDRLRFTEVTLEEARTISREAKKELARRIAELRIAL